MDPWSTPLDAFHFGPSAPQPFDPTGTRDVILGNHGLPPFDEDCLTLNIWAPNRPDGKRPVLVWIHGGGFISGSGSLPVYHGDTFALDGDMIVVTINYRLGTLGFFSDGGSGESNLWLTDQIAALRWVADNIEEFGGDPEKITVAGESGGAFSALALAVTEETSGLISRVILESAPLGLHLATPEEAFDTTRKLLEITHSANVDELRKRPWQELVDATLALLPTSARFGHWATPFVPVVDGNTLTRHPLDAVIDGAAQGIDILIGWNSDEATFAFALRPDLSDLTMDQLLPRFEERFGDAARSMVEDYASEKPGRTPVSTLTSLLSDELFIQPALELAESRSSSSSPVFAYRFALGSPAHNGVLGATHCLELPFVFDNIQRWAHAPFVQGIGGDALARLMHRSWIEFACGRDPVAPDLPLWKRYGPARETMVFDQETRMINDAQGLSRMRSDEPGTVMRDRP
jgi:para-nitrobenzyl esterase